jgi:hypothetical protein
MSVGYYLYAFKRILIEILVIAILLFLCYPNYWDPQLQFLFFICGMIAGWGHRMLSIFSASLAGGYWGITKCGDNKIDFNLTDESIMRMSKLAKMEYSWTLLVHIIDMKSYVLLVLKNHGYVPVPKAVLTQESNAWLDSKLVRRKAGRRRETQVPTATAQSKGIHE